MSGEFGNYDLGIGRIWEFCLSKIWKHLVSIWYSNWCPLAARETAVVW